MSDIEKMLVEYFADRAEVIAVYLFGSYAKGKQRDMSDIDIGILLDENDPEMFRRRRMDYVSGLGRLTRKDVDVVILNSAGEELLKQVLLKGKCILVRDVKKLARAKIVMMSRIAEFGYYKSRMHSGLTKRIMGA